MDTSKEYIEICRKAVEIQELWKPKVGDFSQKGTLFSFQTWHHTDERGYFREIVHTNGRSYSYELIWLPRQDQLQGIVDLTEYEFIDLTPYPIYFRFDFAKPKADHIQNVIGKTMEQLWLAFVMHERFSKSWNGKDWE